MQDITGLAKLLISTNTLTLALLCVLAALVVLGVSLWKRKSGAAKPSSDMADELAKLAAKVAVLEHDMERLAPKLDKLHDEFIEWRTVLNGLKEAIEQGMDRVMRKLEERQER